MSGRVGEGERECESERTSHKELYSRHPTSTNLPRGACTRTRMNVNARTQVHTHTHTHTHKHTNPRKPTHTNPCKPTSPPPPNTHTHKDTQPPLPPPPTHTHIFFSLLGLHDAPAKPASSPPYSSTHRGRPPNSGGRQPAMAGELRQRRYGPARRARQQQ